MIADAKPNDPASDTTSMRYEKISAAKPQAPHIETNLSEEALLRQQAESALNAVRELLGKIQGDMSHVADPREWAERYPWATVAVAAAAGFAAAATIAPRKAPRTASNAAPGSIPPASASDRARYEAYLREAPHLREPSPPPPPKESMWTPLFEMAKLAASRYLLSAVQTGIAAFAASHAATAAQNDDSGTDDNGSAAGFDDSNPTGDTT